METTLGCWLTLTDFVRFAKKHGIEIDWKDHIISTKRED